MTAPVPTTPHPSHAAQRRDAGLASRACLAGCAEASALAAADEAYADLLAPLAEIGATPADLARRLEERGLAALLGWADAVALAGLAGEPWAQKAANRAALAYRDRLGVLMESAGGGGHG